MTTEARIDWAAQTTRLVDAATADRAWYQAVARELVAPGDRLAGDVGGGGAGMALALARHMTCGSATPVRPPLRTCAPGTGSSIRAIPPGSATAVTCSSSRRAVPMSARAVDR